MCLSVKKSAKAHGISVDNTQDAEEDASYLTSVESGAVNGNAKPAPWVVSVLVGGFRTVFKIDTGAEVSVMGSTMYKKIKDNLPALSSTSATLRGPDNSALRIKGVCRQTPMCVRNKIIETDVYIIDSHITLLVGLGDATELDLVRRVDGIGQGDDAIPRTPLPKEFAAVFDGLGCMEGESR